MSDSLAPKTRAAVIIGAVSSAFERMALETRVDWACKNVCSLDGNDIGSGTYNLYLYTQDVPETVRRLVELEQAHRIPPGLGIGVAKYKDSQRKDWTYEPVYPPTLKYFDISYGAKPKGPTP
jgi:hypothetical protein